MGDVELNHRVDKEYGPCGKCGLSKLRQGEAVICPNCDVQAEAKSGLVTTVADPGTDGYIKVTRKAADGSTYEDWILDPKTVASDKDEMNAVKSQGSPVGVTKVSQLPVKKGVGVQATYPATDQGLIEQLRDTVKAMPVDTLSDFKKRKKVIDQIDKLEFLIENLRKEK